MNFDWKSEQGSNQVGSCGHVAVVEVSAALRVGGGARVCPELTCCVSLCVFVVAGAVVSVGRVAR